MSFCGDDVGSFVLLSLVLSELAALAPTALAWRRGDAALGCGVSLLLGLAALLLVVMEPYYFESFGSLLDCATATRPLLIIGTAPVLVLGASAIAAVKLRES